MYSPYPNVRIFSKDKIKGRFEQKIMIKVIIALVVLNIYPSGYSLFFYAWCSSYPSVHNRSSQSLLA